MRDFVRRHPAAAYLVLAFGWAWGWWLPVAGTDMTNLAAVSPLFFVCAMVGGFGPSIAGLVVRRLLPAADRPSLRGTARPGIFAAALLFVPLVTLASLGANRLLGLPADPGDILPRLAIGLVWPLMASVGEEFGWRGLLLPLWSGRHGPFRAALFVGLLWGLWHLPSDWIGLRQLGWWFIPQYLLIGMLNLTVLALVMGALARRTGGDIRIAILFHYTITASAILLGNQAAASPAQTVAATAIGQAVLLAAAIPLLALLRRRPAGKPQISPTTRHVPTVID